MRKSAMDNLLSQLAKQETSLVAVHWALERAARSAGDDALANEQHQWLRTHRGRVYAESTTTDLLRFFNTAVSREVRRQGQQADAAGTR